MTKREIIKALLHKQLPERMGLNEHFWPYIIKNAWQDQGVPPGTDFVQRFGLDLCSISWFSAPGPRPDLATVVEESEDWVIRRDGWGASFKKWKHKAGTPEHVDFTVTSPEIWNNDFREAFQAIRISDYLKIDQLKEGYEAAMAGEAFVTYSSLFVFEELRKVMGDVIMLESLLLEPEWVHDFCSLVTDKYMEYFELLFREVGLPDGIHIYDDLGYTAAPFVSPACHREMIHPYHKKLFGMFKDYNLPVILHTCGDFRPHLPCIVESGVDCIQAMEAKTGMHVVSLAEEYKDKLCFMGNIDIRALESGDRNRIKEECMGKLSGMKKLRAPYIYMSDHSIPPSVKVADYQYMLDLFWDNCSY